MKLLEFMVLSPLVFLFYYLVYILKFKFKKVFLLGSWRGSEFVSYEIELQNPVMEMTSHFELLNQKCLQKFFFRVTNLALLNIKLDFELLT